jgi:hypothetical protein
MRGILISAIAIAALGLAGGGAPAFPAAPLAPTSAGGAIIKVLCKYGTPHCVNPNPRPKPPKVGGAGFPDSGWTDPDCKYYGNCGTGTPTGWGDPSISRRRHRGAKPATPVKAHGKHY